MKYKLYENSLNDINNVNKTIFKNRGIDNYHEYISLDDSCLLPYDKLDNIIKAVEIFDYHYCNKNKIGILFDEDVDGVTSGTLMYKYIKAMYSNYPVMYILHNQAKAHGLSVDVEIPEDIKLLIIPDAGSNDVAQCKALKEQGIDVIILDHHICDIENNYATVVNNQLSGQYSNKELSGVGVVYKFLQALDEFYWNEYADDYLDLVALGLVGDMMNITQYETKRLIEKGLNNISNTCLKSFIAAQDYSMKGIINIHNIQWYITPLVNAMIRVGTYEEKELMIRAFLGDYEEFDYNSRKNGLIKENIYDRAARLCKNAKSRQDRLRTKGFEQIVEICNREKYNENMVILCDVTKIIDSSLTGVVAIRVAEYYKRPCLLLRKHNDNVFGGSGRNFNNSPLPSFKHIVSASGQFEFAHGHDNAFGVEIKKENLFKSAVIFDDMLKGVSYDSQYICDFVLDEEEISVDLIRQLTNFDNYCGTGFNEPLFAIREVVVNRDNVEIMGKEHNSLAFFINESIKIVMFNLPKDDKLLSWANFDDDNNMVKIELVGKACLNNYNNIITPQIIVSDYNLLDKYKNNEELCDDVEDVW